jgi:hypothetical protein
MIIAGDVASPTVSLSNDLKQTIDLHADIFSGKNFLFNLEGAIVNEDLTKTNTPVLYNHSSLSGTLLSFNKVVACLSNNHLFDLPHCFENTIQQLKKNNIVYTGAGKSYEEAHRPAMIEEDGKPVFIFNECWEFLIYHQKNPTNGIYLAEIEFSRLTERVSVCKKENPGACIIIYLHWSLDLEILPYPMYRKFAKKLISAGANVVAGCHSHCVQGGEKFNDGYILYGLGNFFLPNHVFANGKLFFPAFAATQLVFEYDVNSCNAFCHWMQYKEEGGKHTMELLESAPFESSVLMGKYSRFSTMQQSEYITYFKKKRRKHFLIPVFREYENRFMLNLLTGLLKQRASIARAMAKINLIKWGS